MVGARSCTYEHGDLSLYTVQKTIGHLSLQMLSRRYGHLVPELAAPELEKLERALVSFEEPPVSAVAPLELNPLLIS